jgi:hypothetical protein
LRSSSVFTFLSLSPVRLVPQAGRLNQPYKAEIAILSKVTEHEHGIGSSCLKERRAGGVKKTYPLGPSATHQPNQRRPQQFFLTEQWDAPTDPQLAIDIFDQCPSPPRPAGTGWLLLRCQLKFVSAAGATPIRVHRAHFNFRARISDDSLHMLPPGGWGLGMDY